MRKLILWGAMALGAGPVCALEDGVNGVWLQAQDGARIKIAAINVTGDAYDVQMQDDAFGEYFLSMRPFKCVEGPEMLWCHVPYPYEIKRDVSTEATDLEYDFLFLWKPAGSYGIDMWNGVYYELESDGNGLVGTLHEMDMNVLSVPPEDGNLRPLLPKHLEPGDPDSHWLPKLVIGPQSD
ncbi:hypothetical protein [Pelagimonas varians]|uniref:DUF2147 domain-containing protein n=1 Tax=Pelagimonas varians TaxID=696760 RepID=A0A238JR09_9RHOB|nr:hypothetical protein [Pelagimonas varians]PYG34738.1 hypothetical protein C8N36_101394 [Pelagimonas varians]SMX32617.1 hypothetical protein PEV8663_00073 [Pelagimonas varians]